MGVVNVTPDSFSDGGRFLDPQAAVEQGRRLVDEGAQILDVGGESTRPGADAVPAEEELRRVLPVVEGLAGAGAAISIDTSKAAVAAAALDAGASYVNDVTAFRGDPELAGLVAARGVDCCLMHMLGTPRTMQDDPRYDDVVSDVKAFLEQRLAFAVAAGRGRGADHARPRDRVRQDARAQPRAAGPPRRDRRARPAGPDRRLAQGVPRPDHRPRAGRPRPSRPPPRTSSRSSAEPPSSASTTSPRPSMRSPWRLLRWRADGP